MLQELQAIDTSPIEELQALKAEQVTLKERLDRMTALKERVSPEVFARVRADYEGRLAALEERARPLKHKARTEYGKLKKLLATLEQKLRAAQLAKEEVEFRQELGEYTANQFAELLAQAEGELAECQTHLDEARQVQERFLAAVLSEEELELGPPAAEERGVATAEVPATPPTTPGVPEATVQVPPPEETGATVVLPTPRLVVQSPEGASHEFLLHAQTTTIGRSPRNDICIAEGSVSRQHAEVVLTPAGYTVRDLGSVTGVYVNGQRVEERLLAPGDVIELGVTGWTLTFHAS